MRCRKSLLRIMRLVAVSAFSLIATLSHDSRGLALHGSQLHSANREIYIYIYTHTYNVLAQHYKCNVKNGSLWSFACFNTTRCNSLVASQINWVWVLKTMLFSFGVHIYTSQNILVDPCLKISGCYMTLKTTTKAQTHAA
jgi:hypothetical protein